MAVIVSILIIVVSAGLFAYWLGYIIRLVVDCRSVADYSQRVASMVRLNFPGVQAELAQEVSSSRLDGLYRDLDGDYEMVMGLLRDSRLLELEHKLAIVGFRLAGARFRLCAAMPRGNSGELRRRALGDMSEMVEYLAGVVGSSYADERQS